MKIFTVVKMVQCDYDFSVETTKHGAFFNRDNAVARLKEIVEQHKTSIAENIKKYSDKEIYSDEDSGAYAESKDYNYNYWGCSFGARDRRELHQITIEEFDIEDSLPAKVDYPSENKKRYILSICSDSENATIAFADLTLKDIEMIEKDIAGELNSEYTITTIDGQTIETGIIDSITKLD